jgi:hypothetical protein
MLRLICSASLLMSIGPLGCVEESAICGDLSMLEPGPTCTAFCLKAVVACEIEALTVETCAQDCEAVLACERARSQECGDAFEAAVQCATPLDCQDIRDQSNQENLESYPCLPELQARDVACPGI